MLGIALSFAVLTLRVLRPIQRESIANQPLRNVIASNRTYRNCSPVLIQVHGQAIDWPLAEERVQVIRGLGPASILNAIIATAKLVALRCVNAPQANARPVNFERVAVDDAGLPREAVRECC
jgi:hypothetical protein